MAHQLRNVCKYFATSINQENGIVTCLLKHPKLNVITIEFIQKLQDFLSGLECHKPNGLIFVSEFDKKWFSAGFDLKDLYQPCEGRLTQLFGSMLDFSVQIRSTSFPTVTIINGDALGGGCIIPFGCEHRIMMKDTNIGLTEINFGLGVLEWQWLWLAEIIGQRAAEDAILRAKLFSSEEAIRVGLVHEIVSIAMAQQLKNVSKYFTTSLNKENGIVTCLLKHPPVNVITLEFIQKLQSLLIDLEVQKPKGLIFSSDTKCFSAGMDLKEFYQPCRVRLSNYLGSVIDFSVQLRSTSFPTVSIINGYAFGAGCLIPFGCEYRIMLNDTKIGLNEVNYGSGVLEWQSLWLSEIIGRRAAEEAILEAKLFSSEEAVRVGLVHEIVTSTEEGTKKAIAYVDKISKINSRGRYVTKLSLKNDFIKKMRDMREHYISETINELMNPEVQNSFKKLMKLVTKKDDSISKL
ncbi:hypothetical protein FQR65_LT08274 [Abscondita terminalis]|nr:hypothetical protein FQR65_LT08274 [Abscondita terminalis]